MPPFPGLTREEEAEEEEHSILQLRSLLCHKQEHRFFSSQFKALIKPQFRPKPEADPAWKPGMEPLYFFFLVCGILFFTDLIHNLTARRSKNTC